MTLSAVEEEPTVIFDTEDAPLQYAAPNHPDAEDDESLLELRPAQFGKLKFPPLCPVVYTDFTSDPPTVLFTAVQTAYVNIDAHKFVYKLQSGHAVHHENELLFSKGVPVWASIAGDYIPATVMEITQTMSEDASYSVRDALDSEILHHFVPAQAVRYRPADGSTEPSNIPETLKQNLHNQEMPTSMTRGKTTLVQPVTPNESKQEYRDKASNDPYEMNGATTSPADAWRAERPTPPSIKASTREDNKESLQAKRGVMEITDYPSSTSKRQKAVVIRRVLRIPQWVRASSLEEWFASPDKLGLEATCNCKVSLEVSRNGSSKWVHVDGEEYTVSGAMPHVEDFLQASILGEDRKRVFMCDLATMNSDDGCRRGDIVYQRERQTWKWMCALYVPSRNEGVFDAMLQELHGLRASSRCFSRVTRMGAIRLYISSESKTEVELCVSRAKELIEWATGGFPAWK